MQVCQFLFPPTALIHIQIIPRALHSAQFLIPLVLGALHRTLLLAVPPLLTLSSTLAPVINSYSFCRSQLSCHTYNQFSLLAPHNPRVPCTLISSYAFIYLWMIVYLPHYTVSFMWSGAEFTTVFPAFFIQQSLIHFC